MLFSLVVLLVLCFDLVTVFPGGWFWLALCVCDLWLSGCLSGLLVLVVWLLLLACVRSYL